MEVLFFEPYGIKKKHFEWSLELMQRHLDEGDAVTVLGCDASLPACRPNPTHELSKCHGCITRRKHGLATLGAPVRYRTVVRLTAEDRQALRALALGRPAFDDIDELKAFRFQQFAAGYGVASALISKTRNPRPDMKANADLVADLILAGCLVYLSMRNHLGSETYDRVYVNNGREAPQRAVVQACEERGTPFFVYEAGADQERFALYENTVRHNIAYTEEAIRQAWQAADDQSRRAVAHRFYEGRISGAALPDKYFFAKEQRQNLLPQNWDASRHNIVLYNSSEDEFSAIGDQWELPFYASQLDGVRRLAEALAPHAGAVHLYVRMHPNLRTASDASLPAYFDLEGDHVTVVAPESEVSTYALMKAAGAVATFISSTGIEAAYWGKPSILLGRNYYQSLGSVYTPGSHEEAVELLVRRDLPPLDQEGALMYGFYTHTFGEPFRYYQPEGFHRGVFKGVVLRASRAAMLHRFLAARPGLDRAARLLDRWHANRLRRL